MCSTRAGTSCARPAGTRRTTARARSATGGSTWTARSRSPRPAREPLWDPRPLTLLDVGRDLDATASRVYTDLLARTTPLPPQDREDLVALVRRCGVEQVPAHIPVRETMALIFGTWLEFDLVRPHLKTATDVLRVLFVALGGEADLVKLPKPLPNIPRPIRRFVLQIARRPSAGPARRGRPPPRAALEADRREAAPVRVPGPLPEHGAGVRRDPPHPRGRRLHRRGRRHGHARARAPENVRHPARGGARSAGRRARAGARAAPPRRARPAPRPPAAPRRARRPRARKRRARRRDARPAHRDGLDPRAHPPAPEARLLPARGGDERVRHRRHAPADPAGRHRRRRRRHPARADRPRGPRGAARHGRARRAPEGPDRPVPAAPRRPPAAHRPAREPDPAAGRGHAAPVPALDAAGRPARGPRPERPALRRRLAHARPVRLHRPALRGRRHALRRPHVRAGPARRVRVRRPGPARPSEQRESATSSRSSSPTTTSRSTR